MTIPDRPVVDDRDAAAFVEELNRLRPGFVPEWQPGEFGADVALSEIVGRYLAAITHRLNRAPDRMQLALLDTLGVRLVPAQAARAPVVFTLAENAVDAHVPAGSRLAAKAPAPQPTTTTPPLATEPATAMPPGPISFETERATGLAAGRLVELRSVWPGRDQWIDHITAQKDGKAFQPWKLSELEEMPHHLYIAHRTLLALAGSSRVKVAFDLSQGGSEPFSMDWEYWDGKVWRPFASTHRACDRAASELQDSTAGLRQSGVTLLVADCAETKELELEGIKNFWVRARLTEPLMPDPAQLLPEVEQIQLSTVMTHDVSLDEGDKDTNRAPAVVDGFLPDQAIADGAEVDLTKPFYPFGMQPKPGSAFYFTAKELFAKPFAKVDLCYLRTVTPQDTSLTSSPTKLARQVAWEYWNGRAWAELPDCTEDRPGKKVDELDPSDSKPFGTVSFTVPEDFELSKVADIEARWVRVRLVSGSFAETNEIKWKINGTDQSFYVVIPRPPALSDFKLGYEWEFGPFAPEAVLSYNDFQYQNQTDAAIWPGKTFQPFTPPADLTPALYLGFDKPLPVDQLGFFFDIKEDPADSLGPALLWEYWNGGSWRTLSVEDETRRFRLSGLVSLIGPIDSKPYNRFGTARSWLRARLKEDGPPGAPVIRQLLPNATWVVQQQTVVDDPIGTSTGRPEQTYVFRQFPVLAGERIEIRELAGPRANTEWRIVAMELYPGSRRVIAEIEELLGREGVATDVEYGPLRLRRDRLKQVTEVWVRWEYRENLLRSKPGDRHYTLERSRGRLRFGGAGGGRVPPPGAAIVARRYQTGGGSIGNLPVGAIAQLQGAIGGVEKVSNPVPAEGGADGETLDALRARGPLTLRHRGRGLSALDLTTLAKEASPAVAVARALPTRSVDGRTRVGYVTLVIIPASADPRPWPTFGLREQVRRYIEQRGAAAIVGLERIEVTGPKYLALDVEATIIPRDPSQAGEVEQRARAALMRLLHPLTGGPEGQGWEPGRDVYLSDLAAVLERVEGVDYLAHLAISVDGRIGGEQIEVAPDRTVVAGSIRLKLAREG